MPKGEVCGYSETRLTSARAQICTPTGDLRIEAVYSWRSFAIN